MNETAQKIIPKFIADVNLGRLARWLRLLGYDTLYYKSVSLLSLSNIARKEGRIFLTRSRKNVCLKIFDQTLLISSSNVSEQLNALSPFLTLSSERVFSRCSLCNRMLYEVEKEKVKNLVPEYVYQTSEQFKTCRNCGKIYWQGTHIKAMIDIVKGIFH